MRLSMVVVFLVACGSSTLESDTAVMVADKDVACLEAGCSCKAPTDFTCPSTHPNVTKTADSCDTTSSGKCTGECTWRCQDANGAQASRNKATSACTAPKTEEAEVAPQ